MLTLCQHRHKTNYLRLKNSCQLWPFSLKTALKSYAKSVLPSSMGFISLKKDTYINLPKINLVRYKTRMTTSVITKLIYIEKIEAIVKNKQSIRFYGYVFGNLHKKI